MKNFFTRSSRDIDALVSFMRKEAKNMRDPLIRSNLDEAANYLQDYSTFLHLCLQLKTLGIVYEGLISQKSFNHSVSMNHSASMNENYRCFKLKNVSDSIFYNIIKSKSKRYSNEFRGNIKDVCMILNEWVIITDNIHFIFEKIQELLDFFEINLDDKFSKLIERASIKLSLRDINEPG